MDLLEISDKTDKELIFEIFDLNELQRQIFNEINDQTLTVQEIADQVDRNRSTVQRSLQEMMEKDIIMREGKTDKTVYYVYTTIPMKDLKNVTKDAVELWYEEVKEKLS